MRLRSPDNTLQTLDLTAITALSEAAFEADSLAAFEASLPRLTGSPD